MYAQTTDQQRENADLHGIAFDVNVTVLRSDAVRILSRLTLTNPQAQKISQGEYVVYPVDTDYEQELANEFLFTQTPSMKILSVFYPPDDSEAIVNVKKGVLNHFQFTLPDETGSYTAEEEDMSGRYTSQYTMQCGQEHEHVHTLVKEHTLHNYSMMADADALKHVGHSRQASSARMKQRAVINLDHVSGRVTSSHIHAVTALDGDSNSMRKALLHEHTHKKPVQHLETISIPTSSNLTLVASRKGPQQPAHTRSETSNTHRLRRRQGRRALLAEAEEEAEDELKEDALFANVRKANFYDDDEYDANEDPSEVLARLIDCRPDKPDDDENITCFRAMVKRMRIQKSLQCFGAAQLAIAINGSDATPGSFNYHPRFNSARTALESKRNRKFLVNVLAADLRPCVQKQFAGILLLAPFMDGPYDHVKNAILMHIHELAEPQPYLLDAVHQVATHEHPGYYFMGTPDLEYRVDMMATLALGSLIGEMHDAHQESLDIHHTHQKEGPPPVERPEIKELLAVLVNRSKLSGPATNESLYDIPVSHVQWLRPKLTSKLFNPFMNDDVGHQAIHLWWAGHMQQDHVPPEHSKDLFKAWKDHVARHFAGHDPSKDGAQASLDSMAGGFLKWLCEEGPAHLVESFVPGAHEYSKPLKALTTHVNALHNAHHPSTLPQLKELLQDHPSQKIRLAAVTAMGRMRSLEAEDVLLRHIGKAQPDFRVREQAMEALHQRTETFQHTQTHALTHGSTQTLMQQRQSRHTSPERVLKQLEREVIQISFKAITLPPDPKNQGEGGGLSAHRIHLKRMLDKIRSYIYSQPKDVAVKTFKRLARHPYYIAAAALENGDMPHKPHLGPYDDDDNDKQLSPSEQGNEWDGLMIDPDDGQMSMADVEPLFGELNRTGMLEHWLAEAAAESLADKSDGDNDDKNVPASPRRPRTHLKLLDQIQGLCVATNRTDMASICSKMATQDVMRRRLASQDRRRLSGRSAIETLMDMILREYVLRLGFLLGTHQTFGQTPMYGAELLVRLRNEAEVRFSMFGFSAFVDLDNEFKASMYLLGFEFVVLRAILNFFAGASYNFYMGAGKISLRGINPFEAIRSIVAQTAFKPDTSQLMEPSLVKALALNLKIGLLPQTQEFVTVLPPIANASLVDSSDAAYCFNVDPANNLLPAADATHSFFTQIPFAVTDISRVDSIYEDGIEWQLFVDNVCRYERQRKYDTVTHAHAVGELCYMQREQFSNLSTALAEKDSLRLEAIELHSNASLVSNLAVEAAELPSILRSFFANVQSPIEVSASFEDVEEVASFAAFANLTNATSIAMAAAPLPTELTALQRQLETLLASNACLAAQISAADDRATKASSADVSFHDGTYSEGEEGSEQAAYEQLQDCLRNVSATLESMSPLMSAIDSVRAQLLELKDASEKFALTDLLALEELEANLRSMDERVGLLLSTSDSRSKRTVGSIAAALVLQDPLASASTGLYAQYSEMFASVLASSGASVGMAAELMVAARNLQDIVDIDSGSGSPNSTGSATVYSMAHAQARGQEYSERVKQLPGPLVSLYRSMGKDLLPKTLPTDFHISEAKKATVVANCMDNLIMTLTLATNNIANYTSNMQITLQTFVAEDPSEDFSNKAVAFQKESNAYIEQLSDISSRIDGISANLVMHVEGNRDMTALSHGLSKQKSAIDDLNQNRKLGNIYDAATRVHELRAAIKPLLETCAQVKPELARLTTATALLASAVRVAARSLNEDDDGSDEGLETKTSLFDTLRVAHGSATTLLLQSFLAPANKFSFQSPAFNAHENETTGVDVWVSSLKVAASQSTAVLSTVDVRRVVTMGVFKAAEELSPDGPSPVLSLFQLAQREVKTLMHENMAPLTLGIAADPTTASSSSLDGDDDDDLQHMSCMLTSHSFCPRKLGSQHLRWLQRRLLTLQKSVSSAASMLRFDERGPMGLDAPSGTSSASPSEVVQRLVIFAGGTAALTRGMALTLLDADTLAEQATMPLPSGKDGDSNAFGYLRKTSDCSAQASSIVSKTESGVAHSLTLLAGVEAQHTLMAEVITSVDTIVSSLEESPERDLIYDIVEEFGSLTGTFGGALKEFWTKQQDVESSALEQLAKQAFVVSAPKMVPAAEVEAAYLRVVDDSQAIQAELFDVVSGGYEKKISDFRLTLGAQFGIISPGYGAWGVDDLPYCSDPDVTTGEIPEDGACLRLLEKSNPDYWPKSVKQRATVGYTLIFDKGMTVKSKFAHFLNLASQTYFEFAAPMSWPKRYRYVVPGLFDSYTAKGIARIAKPAFFTFSWAFLADFSESRTTLLSLVPTDEQAEKCRPSLFVAMQKKCEGEGRSRTKCIRAIFMLRDEDDNPWQGSVGGITTDENKWVWSVDDGSVNNRNNGIGNTSLPLTRKTLSRTCLSEPTMAKTARAVREQQHITIDPASLSELSAGDVDMVNGQIRLVFGDKKSLPVSVSMSSEECYNELRALTGGESSSLKMCDRVELPSGGVRWETWFDERAGDVAEITAEWDGNDCCCSCCAPIIESSHASYSVLVPLLVNVTEHIKGFDGAPVAIEEEPCYNVGATSTLPCYSNFLVGFDLKTISNRIESCSPYCKPMALTINGRWNVDSYPGGVHYQKMTQRVGEEFFTPKSVPAAGPSVGIGYQTSTDKMFNNVIIPSNWLWIHDSPAAAEKSVIPGHHWDGSVIGYPLDSLNREPVFFEHNLPAADYAARFLLDETRNIITRPVVSAVREFLGCAMQTEQLSSGSCDIGISEGALQAFFLCDWKGGLVRWATSAINSELSQKLALPSPDDVAGYGGLLERVHDAMSAPYASTMASIESKALVWAVALVTASSVESPTSSVGSKMVLPFASGGKEVQSLAEGLLGAFGSTPSPLQTALTFFEAELQELATPTILLAAAANSVSATSRQQLAAELASALLVHEHSLAYPVALADCVVRQTANTSCVRTLSLAALHSSEQLLAMPPSLRFIVAELDAPAVSDAVHTLAVEQLAGRRHFTDVATPMAMPEEMYTRALPIRDQASSDFTGAFFAALEPIVPACLRSIVFPVPDLNKLVHFVREEVPSGLNTAFGISPSFTLATVTADATELRIQAEAAATPPSTLPASLMLEENTRPFALALGTCNADDTSSTCDLDAVIAELLKLAGDYLANREGLSAELGNAVMTAASFGDTRHLLEKLGHAVNASAIGVDGQFVAEALVATMLFADVTDTTTTSSARKAQLAAAPALASNTARFLSHALNTSASINSSSSFGVPRMIALRAIEDSSLLLGELESFAVATLFKVWAPGALSSSKAADEAIKAIDTGGGTSIAACTSTSLSGPCSAADLGVAALQASFGTDSLRRIRDSTLLLPARLGNTVVLRNQSMPVQVRSLVRSLLEQLEYTTFGSSGSSSSIAGTDVAAVLQTVLADSLNKKRPRTSMSLAAGEDSWSTFVGHVLDASVALALGQPQAQGQLELLLPSNSTPALPLAPTAHILDISQLNFTLKPTSASSMLALHIYDDVVTMSKDVLTTAHMCTTTTSERGVEVTQKRPCWGDADIASGHSELTMLIQAAISGDGHTFKDTAMVLANSLLMTTTHGSSSEESSYKRMPSSMASAVVSLDGPTMARVISESMSSCAVGCRRSFWADTLSQVYEGDPGEGPRCQTLEDKVNSLAISVFDEANSKCTGLCAFRIHELATVGGGEGLWMEPLVAFVVNEVIGLGAGNKQSATDIMSAVEQQFTYNPITKMSPPEFPRGVYRPTHQMGVGANVRGFALVEQFRTSYVALTRCELSVAQDCTMEFYKVDTTPRKEKTWKKGNVNWAPCWLIQDDNAAIIAFLAVFKRKVKRTIDGVAQYSFGNNAGIPNAIWPRDISVGGMLPAQKNWWSLQLDITDAKMVVSVPMGIEGMAYDWAEIADHLYIVFSGGTMQYIDQVEALSLPVDDGYYKMRPPIIESIPFNVSSNEYSVETLFNKFIIPPTCIIALGHECDKCKCSATDAGCKKGAYYIRRHGKRKTWILNSQGSRLYEGDPKLQGCSKKDLKKIKGKSEELKKRLEDKKLVEEGCTSNCEKYCRCKKELKPPSGVSMSSQTGFDQGGCGPEKAKCTGKCSRAYLIGPKCRVVKDSTGKEEKECDAKCKQEKEDAECDPECKKKKATAEKHRKEGTQECSPAEKKLFVKCKKCTGSVSQERCNELKDVCNGCRFVVSAFALLPFVLLSLTCPL
jgi:hypothetical protein